jgi:hypothetical protein
MPEGLGKPQTARIRSTSQNSSRERDRTTVLIQGKFCLIYRSGNQIPLDQRKPRAGDAV